MPTKRMTWKGVRSQKPLLVWKRLGRERRREKRKV